MREVYTEFLICQSLRVVRTADRMLRKLASALLLYWIRPTWHLARQSNLHHRNW